MVAPLKSLPFLTLLTHLLFPVLPGFCSACYSFTASPDGLFAESVMTMTLVIQSDTRDTSISLMMNQYVSSVVM